MTQLRILFLLVLSALVSALVAMGAIFVSIDQGWLPESASSIEVIEIARVIEPTPILNAPVPLIIIDGEYKVLYDPINPDATMPVMIVTVTPQSGVSDEGFGNRPATAEVAEITPESFAIEGYATAIPSGCTLHTVSVGESLSFIAARWGVDLDLLLDINGLTLDDALSLQPGDRLIIPWASCVAEIYRQQGSGGAAGGERFATEPPQVLAIEAVRGIGTWELEEVVIRNRGETSADLAGWRLSDDAGNSFRFGNQRLFAGAELRIATRSGTDLPTQLYWGLPSAIWFSGARVTLTAPDGVSRVQFTIP